MSELDYLGVLGQKPREIAARVLLQRARGLGFVEDLLERALAARGGLAADRALAQELVFGVVRWERTLDWLIARKTGGRTQKPGLQILLRLGLYQMFWLSRIPDHAAVNESVELARQLGFGPQSGFVNAVLRGYLRERDATEAALRQLKETDPALGRSHPEWLCQRWEQRLGRARLLQLLDWNNAPAITYARVNGLKTDANGLREQWQREKVEARLVPCPWAGDTLVFELQSFPALNQLRSFLEGKFYVQDPSTLLAVTELDPAPGETILDYCAAPGGKTTFIAERMKNQGRLIAHDTSPARLERVVENCRRLGVANVETALPADVGARLGNGLCDRLLVDAPCSNTGVMRRRIDLRWRIRPEEIERLRATQLKLLEEAVARLKPGGTLVYSTCSLEPEENHGVISEFLGRHSFMHLRRERSLTPWEHNADGAYVASLVRGQE